MSDIIQTPAPAPLKPNYNRNLPLFTPLDWVRKGIKDTFTNPSPSLAYGLLVTLTSMVVVAALFLLDIEYILLPALSGFLVVGPAIAVGLYYKSRQLAQGRKAGFRQMLLARGESPRQVLLVGLMLMLLMVLWFRAAFLLYALFFGMLPFPGFDQLLYTVFTTARGWFLLGVGTLIGGLFAAFSFAISAFSIPMLLSEKMDAFSAMGISLSIAWANKAVSIVWGLIIISFVGIGILTAFIGFVLIFPILGHATWHAYKAMRVPNEP